MGTFSVYISLGSVPSLFFSDSFILYSLRQESKEIIIKRKMKLLFQLAMTFLALVCLATAIPAPFHGGGGISHGQRLEESVVEPKKEQNLAKLKRAQNLLRMAIPVPRPTKKDDPRGNENLLRMAIPVPKPTKRNIGSGKQNLLRMA